MFCLLNAYYVPSIAGRGFLLGSLPKHSTTYSEMRMNGHNRLLDHLCRNSDVPAGYVSRYVANVPQVGTVIYVIYNGVR